MMELKPGYRHTEVGVIPEGWNVKRVGDICSFIVPGRNKPKNFDGDIPWVTTPDLNDGGSVSASRLGLCVSKEEAKNIGSKIVPPGSVLMSCAGELGVVAFTTNEIVINQQLHAFIPSSVIDGTFLLYAIKSQKAHIDGLATKTAVSYLNKYNCNSIPIPFPPLPEQRAIAGVLSDIDALIRALEKVIVKKRDLKQAAMQQLLTCQKRLPGFTEEWQTAQLKSIYATVFKKSPISSSDGVAQGSYLLFVSGGEPKWVDTALYSNTEALIFSDGGVFDVRYFVGDFSVTDHCYVVSLYGDMRFYFYWLSLFKQVLDPMTFKGSGLRNLDKTELGRVKVPVPSETEQTAIADVLSDMGAEIGVLEQRLAKTRALKQGMMQELLTGRTRLI
jgi:type I restriction enzyme S subunit